MGSSLSSLRNSKMSARYRSLLTYASAMYRTDSLSEVDPCHNGYTSLKVAILVRQIKGFMLNHVPLEPRFDS